jgi:hypothetical protein
MALSILLKSGATELAAYPLVAGGEKKVQAFEKP